jgi:hypothetical protein
MKYHKPRILTTMEINTLGLHSKIIGTQSSLEDGSLLTFICKRKKKRKTQIELIMPGREQENYFVKKII